MKSALNGPCLVFNKNFKAIGTTTVREALILMSRDSAKGLCVSTFRAFSWKEWLADKVNPPVVREYVSRGPNMDAVPAPEVIVLQKYSEIYKRTVRFSTRALYRRDDYVCQYCGKKFSEEGLSVDHVVPRAAGGRTSWTNCVTACLSCNNKKADKSLKECGYTLKKKPERPQWNPIIHIREENRPESWKALVPAEWWNEKFE